MTRCKRRFESRHDVFTALLLAASIWLAGACAARASEAEGTGSWNWREHLTLTLSDRVRGEFVDWFEPPSGKAPAGAHRYNFMANQLRLGAKLTVPHVKLTLEMQDTRLVNLPADASPPVSQVGNLGPGAIYFANTRRRDQGEPFLKQGHLLISDIPGNPGVAATLGRFEYSDGLESIPADAAVAWLKRARIGERLIGPFGYTHVTRSFDGARVAYDAPDTNLTVWGSRPTRGGFEVSANPELDIWLAGVALTLKQIANLPPLDARAFYLYYEDDRDGAVKIDNRSTAARNADTKSIAIHTWGGHALSVVSAGPGKVDGLLWGAVQTGEWGQLTHVAWAYAAETGYQLPQLHAAPWVRVGYNRSSGDNDPLDNKHHTFFQLLPTARIYAQFPFYNLMNNEDLFAQLVLKPHARVTVRTDYHWLRVTDPKDLWYSGGGATNDTFFGYAGLRSSNDRRELAHLVDLAITVSLLKQLSAYAYYGHAFGQGVVKSSFAGAEANYGYFELTFRC